MIIAGVWPTGLCVQDRDGPVYGLGFSLSATYPDKSCFFSAFGQSFFYLIALFPPPLGMQYATAWGPSLTTLLLALHYICTHTYHRLAEALSLLLFLVYIYSHILDCEARDIK